ncbi:hypothetical protein [Pseudomonas sp. CGJS7]|uniref:hypothetical protein n=1 Tax=Pseudomonas sp. CGJS7 TaxID=3109348 RepID=UPI00300853BF
MHRPHRVVDDFEAVIRIHTQAEGGRRSPPLNGIRWDFAYADDPVPNRLYMIWPDFFDADGNSLPGDVPLPVDVELRARMTVVVDEMRSEVHQGRIRVGVKFYCQEGPKRVASGVVTRITHLHDERTPLG